MRRIAILAFVICVFVAGFAPLAFSGGPMFNHSLLDSVLDEYVENGRVEYRRLVNNQPTLNTYLRKVSDFSPAYLYALPKRESVAFYINVYNALVLKAVVEEYPVSSIKKVHKIWKKKKFPIAGKGVTLDEIEETLRFNFKDPRIHFALVRGSRSCPKLLSQAYTGDNINKLLNRQTYRFIDDKSNVRFDRRNNVLYVSPIFKEYSQDFGDVLAYVTRYMSKRKASYLRRKQPTVKYIKHNWNINEKWD